MSYIFQVFVAQKFFNTKKMEKNGVELDLIERYASKENYRQTLIKNATVMEKQLKESSNSSEQLKKWIAALNLLKAVHQATMADDGESVEIYLYPNYFHFESKFPKGTALFVLDSTGHVERISSKVAATDEIFEEFIKMGSYDDMDTFNKAVVGLSKKYYSIHLNYY